MKPHEFQMRMLTTMREIRDELRTQNRLLLEANMLRLEQLEQDHRAAKAKDDAVPRRTAVSVAEALAKQLRAPR